MNFPFRFKMQSLQVYSSLCSSTSLSFQLTTVIDQAILREEEDPLSVLSAVLLVYFLLSFLLEAVNSFVGSCRDLEGSFRPHVYALACY